jgi:hypothetical protein
MPNQPDSPVAKEAATMFLATVAVRAGLDTVGIRISEASATNAALPMEKSGKDNLIS